MDETSYKPFKDKKKGSTWVRMHLRLCKDLICYRQSFDLKIPILKDSAFKEKVWFSVSKSWCFT